MATKTIITCDRCGAAIEPASKTGIQHTKMELTTLDRKHVNAPIDLCDRCTQSLKMWLGNLPNREVKYWERGYPFLKGGSISDVMLRIAEGAPVEDFRRQSWSVGEVLGIDGIQRRLIRVLSEEGHSDDLTAEDFQAEDWVQKLRIVRSEEEEEG